MPARKKEKSRFTIIRDTREQNGYQFEPDPDYCDGTEVGTLKTGDYTLKGFEDQVCVERKFSTGELSGNLSEARFQRELDRMQSFKYRFIVFEFSLQDILNFPVNSGIPEAKHGKLRITGKYMLRRIVEMQMAGINVVFCENKRQARHYVWYLMKRVFEELHG